MYVLKADGLSLEILDFLCNREIMVVDAKFEGKEAFDAFLEFSKKHATDDTVLDYMIDTEKYKGHFGLIVYDVDYNVRFYMTTTPRKDDYGLTVNIWKDNVTRIIENQRFAITKIATLLKNAKLASEDEVNEILQCVPAVEYGFAIGHRVNDLHKYLVETKETMEDLRKEY